MFLFCLVFAMSLFAFVYMCFVVTCWERADLLALVCGVCWVLEWSQHFSHYKSMGIFPDTQGQLTHKSLLRSCQISNPFEILWFSCKTKEKQIKNEGARMVTRFSSL